MHKLPTRLATFHLQSATDAASSVWATECKEAGQPFSSRSARACSNSWADVPRGFTQQGRESADCCNGQETVH